MSDDCLGKIYDEEKRMIRWKTGPIKDRPGYALTKTGSVVRTHPRILSKKERRRNQAAVNGHREGYHYVCRGCRARTFHFGTLKKVRIEGYEKPQRILIYQCAICGLQDDAELIDMAVEQQERDKELERQALEAKPE